jgi:hypothetical protein
VYRWLIDTDRDEEGMQVLADLHGGGDIKDERAVFEFNEIKEGVVLDVRNYVSLTQRACILNRLISAATIRR